MFRNVVVGQSGGPTAVINSSLAGVYKTAKELGAKKVYGMRYGIQGFLQKNIIDLGEKLDSELNIEMLKRTPSAYLGSCRYKLPNMADNPEVYETIFNILQDYEIDAFFYIGGNDSMDTIKKLAEYAESIDSPIRFMGVPKTIDNDLAAMDHTPGYGSAAKYIATVTKELIRDGMAYDMKFATVIEVMGRNAGWLTAATALARGEDCEGVDLIYLPELPFEVDKFIEKARELFAQKKNVVIAVSEGVKTPDGKYVFECANENGSVDAFGHKELSGTARYLASLLKKEFSCKTRVIELASLQRCAGHLTSRVDITEAYQVGGSAVKAAYEGTTGMVVTLERISTDPYICTTGLHDVREIANIEKKVPIEWIIKDGTYVSDELVHYIMPLIQAELSPIMITGQPRHIVVD